MECFLCEKKSLTKINFYSHRDDKFPPLWHFWFRWPRAAAPNGDSSRDHFDLIRFDCHIRLTFWWCYFISLLIFMNGEICRLKFASSERRQQNPFYAELENRSILILLIWRWQKFTVGHINNIRIESMLFVGGGSLFTTHLLSFTRLWWWWSTTRKEFKPNNAQVCPQTGKRLMSTLI